MTIEEINRFVEFLILLRKLKEGPRLEVDGV
jgi:hypothetical protein